MSDNWLRFVAIWVLCAGTLLFMIADGAPLWARRALIGVAGMVAISSVRSKSEC